ncbi:DUF4942 domain-containing protein [Thiomicrospira sp.]|uniref:DUF4942 domain-containing protein n=1 Tax=Thiomicrospira sp. TaxID=935 RepID=UPI002F929263
MKKTNQSLLNQAQLFGEDYEWYPTTNEQIACVFEKLKSLDIKSYSILDVGAGNGKVFDVLTQLGKNDPDTDKYSRVVPDEKYAIEKSKPLIDALPESVFLVGCDFYEQTLIDKRVGVIFSNPPYSEYSPWATKIIKEANADHLFLVLPKRWVFDPSIQEAIRVRRPSLKEGVLGYEILGSFDYLNAEDRKARAKVDVIYIALSKREYGYSQPERDPFSLWFDEAFSGFSAPKDKVSDYERQKRSRESLEKKLEGELVSGGDLAQVLVRLYQQEMNHLFNNYKAVSELDADILETLGVDVRSVKEAVKQRIESIKHNYWNELFGKLDKITDKLTHSSRELMLGKLTKHTSVDFSLGNIYAVLSWVFKNANKYFDQQLIQTYERMIEQANVVPYKSNQRVFSDFNWRYNRKPDDLTHFKLEYRIVLESCGGIFNSHWTWESGKWCGLSERAAIMIDDLITVAGNLGFNVIHNHRSFYWTSGKKNEICYIDSNGKHAVLFEARAFKNGNQHLRLSPKFAAKLNVEFGRLKGWLNSAEQAADELDISVEDAQSHYRSNYALSGGDSVLKLVQKTPK